MINQIKMINLAVEMKTEIHLQNLILNLFLLNLLKQMVY